MKKKMYYLKNLIFPCLLLGSAHAGFSRSGPDAWLSQESLLLSSALRAEKGAVDFPNIRYTEVAPQQGVTVTGRVLDEAGNGLPGVTVMLKGTTQGTSTDLDGNYSLSVPGGSGTLVVSFVGYTSQEIAINNRASVNISLAPDAKALDEVVVVGYGTQSQRNITGAVQTVKSEEFTDLPVPQVAQKLQGRLAGVQILQTTGRPGEGMTVRVRGQASASAGNQPLYVVDGFPISGDISTLNPDEIETISVLKDAASTSMYGSRASNGVVIVTTKRARSGQTTVGLNSFYGVQQIPSSAVPEVMNAREFAQYMKEVHEENKRAVPEIYQNPSQYGEGTDWYDLLTRTASIQNHSVSFNAGGEKFSTSAVLGFFDQQGVIINTGYKRFSARLNSEYRFNDRVRVGVNIAPTVANTSGRPTDGGPFTNTGGMLTSALLASPLAPAVNPDGSLPITAHTPGMLNVPNWYRVAREADGTNRNNRLLSNAFLEYEVLKGLVLKTSINAELGETFFKNFVPSTSGNVNQALPRASGDLTLSNNKFFTWLSENTATYSKEIGDHSVEVLGGYTAQKFRADISNVTATNFPNDLVRTLSAATSFVPTSSLEEWSLLSYLGRLNYNYKGKYLFSASLRRDGSSRFGSNNKWGNFPSVSAGWIVSDESFMQDLSAVSFLKLRTSYGLAGNFNIGNFTYFEQVSSTNSGTSNNYVFNNALAPGNNIVSLANPNLGWERTSQFDIGFDLGLFDDRIFLGYDYYTKTTDGLLFQVQVPTHTGFSSLIANIGEFQFWGHEFTLSTRNLVGDFKWNSDFNISFNRNEVMQLGTANAALGGGTSRNITMVGQPIGMLWGYVADGVYMNQADFDNSPKFQTSTVGAVKMRDVNGDGVITVDDRTIIGNPNPDFIFGFTNNFAWKNFDLSIVASGSVGNDIMNTSMEYINNLDGVFNVTKDVANRWRSEENPGDGVHPRVLAGTTGLFRNANTLWVTDGSFLTVKNISLGYNLPQNLIKHVRSLRVYGSIQQALVLTKYKGSNPEVNAGGENPLAQGLDLGAYPVPRTFTIGVNLGL
ncbi:SusC/RagA family TonB-linked outer membrane protein [Pontibacter beigongshangensis]|uniref:SusC/RagA family TonB-linked outer membrane protein n=1 Tax=Pontibacter beigongshangensis TaxID=2574733 RepID=UPI0019D4F3E7|nr:TonB-dependent receptor [Pontibacter beigongshangensis]